VKPARHDGPSSRQSETARAVAPSTTLTDTELDALRAQVEQARGILADAVAKLSGSFSTMETETKVQKDMMKALLASLSRDGDESEPPRSQEQPQGQPPGSTKINIREFTIETGAFLTQFTDLLASVSQQSIRTVYRIDDMVEQLDAVFSLINSINGIADETFILAVNASIEAARTKDVNTQSGHSFSVIASNIRELSKKTRRFNDQIGTQIGQARTTVNEVREIIAAMASRDLNVALSGKERIELMMKELAGFQQFMTDNVDRASVATSRIAEATSQAVTAMQFEDILNQLLMSIRHRAERIAGEGGEPPTTASPFGRTSLNGPVQQHNMTPGKVELF
jgi:methyl-accepting chemotaxis protein